MGSNWFVLVWKGWFMQGVVMVLPRDSLMKEYTVNHNRDPTIL